MRISDILQCTMNKVSTKQMREYRTFQIFLAILVLIPLFQAFAFAQPQISPQNADKLVGEMNFEQSILPTASKPFSFFVIKEDSFAKFGYLKAPKVKFTEKDDKIVLSWNRVSGAVYYTIKRGTTLGELTEIASNITDLNYQDNTAKVHTTYYYAVVAVDKYNKAGKISNILLKLDIPKVPVLFGGWDKNVIRLSWKASSEQDKYIIYRCLDANSSYTQIAETFLTEFCDEDVNSKNEYLYVIRASNMKGESGNSSVLKVTPELQYQKAFIPYVDSDGDGLKNEDELIYGVDKDKMDTDGDGLSDAYEMKISRTNPLDSDMDSDGIFDGVETALGTDPIKKNPAKKVTKYAKSENGNVTVIAKGITNTAIELIQVRESKNLLINSIPGILGNAMEVVIGKQPQMQAFLSFCYKDLHLGDTKEDDITIFYIDTTNKKMIAQDDVTAEPTTNSVTCPIKGSGFYLLGSKKMSKYYGKLDIIFAVDTSSLLSGAEFENKRINTIGDFLDKLNLSEARFGIVGFSDKKYLNRNLTTSKKKIRSVFEHTYKQPEESDITLALSEIEKSFGNNDSSGKIAILISGAKNKGDREKAMKLATEIASKNIRVYTMAFGKNADTSLLQDIAQITHASFINLDNGGKYKIKEVDAQFKFAFEKISERFDNIYLPILPSKNILPGEQMERIDKSGEIATESFNNSNEKEETRYHGQDSRIGYDSEIKKMTRVVVVKASTAKARKGKSEKEPVIGVFHSGEVLKMINNEGEYIWVQMPDGQQGVLDVKDVQIIFRGIEVNYGAGISKIFKQKGFYFISPEGCTDTLLKINGGYLLTTKDNSKYTYENLPSGRLISIIDSEGISTGLKFKKDGTLDTVVDSTGRKTICTYSDTNEPRLVSCIDENGTGIYIDYINRDKNKGRAMKYEYAQKQDEGKSDCGIGVLSEKYESRGAGGAACIAKEDRGGKSYGAWQFATIAGTVDTFLNWIYKKSVDGDSVCGDVYRKLTDAKKIDNGFGSNFDAKWKEIAAALPNEFLEMQASFIKLKYFDRADSALKKFYGFDISKRSRAIKSVLFSTSVQHGTGVTGDNSVYTYTGSVPIFRKALEICLKLPEETLLKSPPNTYDYSKISDEQIINAVYDERSKCMIPDDMKKVVVNDWGRADASKVFTIENIKSQSSKETAIRYSIENFVLYHFCGNGADVQSMVYKRLDVNERADALRMLFQRSILP